MGYNYKLWCKAKAEKNRRWVEGYYVRLPSGGGSADMIHSPARNPDKNNEIHFVDPDTVCQCIARPDRNGVPLFEGDFVRFSYPTMPDAVMDGVVVWSAESLQWYIKSRSGARYSFTYVEPQNIEITGNIHG